MTQTILARFRFRHGTAAEWTASNEVLLADEGGHEADTNKLKIGDGVTAWSTLPYFGGYVSSYMPITTSGNLTLAATTHRNKMLLQTGGVITAGPTVAAGFAVGDSIQVRQQTSSVVSFKASGTATLDYNTTAYVAQMAKSKDVIELKVLATDTWGILGALATPAIALSGAYPAGKVGTAYSSSLSITGGVTPYSNPRITSGALPSGFSLSVSGGLLILANPSPSVSSQSFTVAIDSTDGQTATSPQSVSISASSQWVSTVMADSPYAFWRMDDTSGTVMTDASGNANHGSYRQGAETLTTAGLLSSDTDNAILASSGFTGSYASSIGVISNSDWSVECLLKPSSAPIQSGAGCVWAQSNVQYAPALDIIDNADGTFHFRVMAQSGVQVFVSAGKWAYGTKLVVMLTYKSSTNSLTLYVNGAVDSTGTYNYISNTPYTTWGYNFVNNGYPMAGVLDEGLLYQSCLTASRALAHYNNS